MSEVEPGKESKAPIWLGSINICTYVLLDSISKPAATIQKSMARKMETVQDLIKEGKTRALVWVICILALAYFLSLTSRWVWLNIPISFLIISVLRYLSLEVEIHRRVPTICQPSYLSYLQSRQLSPHDPLPFPARDKMKWKRNIDSPVVEVAVDEFTRKIVQEFVTDLWYSSITPDQEFPEQICLVLNDVIGEISQRVRHINLIDLLTRDMMNLIGSHLELYRRNQARIGVHVMRTLSSEERDERLKHCLASAKELHPALISPEDEYKVLERLMGAVVTVVLRPQEAQCPIVRCLARELLACAVMQPIMNFASPGFINEMIEFIVLSSNEAQDKKMDKEELADMSTSKSSKGGTGRTILKDVPVSGPELFETGESKGSTKDRKSAESASDGVRASSSSYHDSNSNFQLNTSSYLQSRPADWAQALDAIRQKRTEVLAPENLDNLWTKGRNYRKKDITVAHTDQGHLAKSSVSRQEIEGTVKQVGVLQIHESVKRRDMGKSVSKEMLDTTGGGNKNIGQIMFESSISHPLDSRRENQDPEDGKRALQVNDQSLLDKGKSTRKKEKSKGHEIESLKADHKQSVSGGSSLEGWQKVDKSYFPGGEAWYSKKSKALKLGEADSFPNSESLSTAVWPQTGNIHVPKLKCWVLGAHFERVGSKSFAVYSIAVTNSENKTWFVDRRYRNFEQLHRRLRDIPNYTLQLPPKRFLSSSVDDYFVQKRCILLDKYLKDLLSIPNIAEQHEVWDFLSATSKNYSFRKTPSVMKTLAVNVDDAMDDIVRQLKEVSDGLRRKVAGVTSSSEGMPSELKEHPLKLSWTSETSIPNDPNCDRIDRSLSASDDEEGVGERTVQEDIPFLAQRDGWHSDSELQIDPLLSQSLVGMARELQSSDFERNLQSERKCERHGSDGCSTVDSLTGSDIIEDEAGVPPEWTPPKLSVPLLNLVDNIFQLNRRGWLRRQVFWISKQILQVVMEDAIDDWLLRQIEWLRRDDVIALGIRWIQDVLWPNGVFISNSNTPQQTEIATGWSPSEETAAKESGHVKISAPLSFEQQLEAARRASVVHDILLGGAPSTLVSLIGGKQYRRCANDIYFFLQSSVCVKQLAYSLLELLLIATFPELQEVVLDIHGNTRG